MAAMGSLCHCAHTLTVGFFSQGPEESFDTPGVADINREYRDSQNPNMQAGKARNIQILKDFGRCREKRGGP